MDNELRRLVDEEKKNEVAEQLPQMPPADSLVDSALSAAVVAQVQNNEGVQKRIVKTADKVINTTLETAEDNAEKESKAAHLQNNQDACDLYGIDEKTVPRWVVDIANLVQNFWYGVWLVIGFFTTAPIVFLAKKIKVIIKRSWVAVTLAVIIYLAIATVPLILKLIKII